MNKPYLVGITGGSASGKTSFLREIGNLFGPNEVCILSQDNYYRPAGEQTKDENGHINYDLPGCIDLDAFKDDIIKLSLGETVRRREYRFQHEEQMGDWLEFESAPIVIIEGLFIFYREDISSHFNLKGTFQLILFNTNGITMLCPLLGNTLSLIKSKQTSLLTTMIILTTV